VQACNSFQGKAISLNAMVFDTCPSCNSTQLNLHHLAFQKIARTRFGNVQIAYKQVSTST
jgi:expansin (peptidoglycan-binding protein)